ncbi:MAG: hypothetical protein ACPGED_12395, partial [Flavobacteriales bacterium]
RAQQDAQTWNDILFTSGGKLELPKCGFHVIYYEYTEAGIPYMLHSTNRPINLKANDNTQIPIQEKDIHTSRKNLGHFKSPSRNYIPQLNNLCTKATELSKAITSCPVSRDEAKQLYETVFRPAIEYPIGQSFLTPKQLHSIEAKALPWIIAKCGYNRNTSRQVIFGPSNIGGAGFTPLYSKAGTEYVLHFLKHLRTPWTQCGKLIRMTLEWSQFQAGLTQPILEHPKLPIGYVQGVAAQAVRQYLSEIEGIIKVDYEYTPKELRIGDTSLMQKALDLSYTLHQMRRINAVRLYYKVTFVSELCNLKGNQIRQEIFQTTELTHYTPKPNALHQPEPDSKSFKLWRRFLRNFCIGRTRYLINPLG